MSTSRSQSLLFALAGAALGVVALTGGYLLTSSGEERTAADDSSSSDGGRTPTGDPTEQRSEPTEEPTGSTEPTGDPTGDPTGGDSTVTVPAYFVVDTEKAGPRLVREFQRVPADDPLGHALALLTDGATQDPDYRTLWPGGGFASTTYDEAAGVITVELADDGWTTLQPGLDETAAERALQQVVYTAQGVVQARPRVEFVLGGNPATVFGVDTDGGIAQASPLSVLNHVSLTTPAEGEVVEGGVLEVSGVGNSFEAGIGWEIRDASGDVVRDGGATMAGWMEDRLFPFEKTVRLGDLPPGDYEVFVTTDDPTGGTEGIGAMTDTRWFSVR